MDYPKDAVDALVEARAYVDKGWCQWSHGRTDDGSVISFIPSADAFREQARSWCVGGAFLQIAEENLAWAAGRELLARVVGLSDVGDIVLWNDAEGRTKDEVLEAFDKAISLGLREEDASLKDRSS